METLPKWIKTGTAAMLGTTHTTRVFPSRSALLTALLPYKDLGRWSFFEDDRWSARKGRMVDGWAGCIFKERPCKL